MFTRTGTTTANPGGRFGVRRVAYGHALVLGLVLAAPALGASGKLEPGVRVRSEGGVYMVDARFEIPQSPEAALAVLTDYEQIPRFMPGVTASVVRERSGGRVVIEQQAVSRVMMFSRRIHLLLEVYEEGRRIRFRDAGGRSFACYEGAWSVAAIGGSTEIRYELRAKPSFEVPGFLLGRLLKRDARQMIEQLSMEIAARGVTAPERTH